MSHLITDACLSLGGGHDRLAAELATSTRTISRWRSSESKPSKRDLVTLVGLVHAANPELAAEIAHVAGETLDSLGLAPGTRALMRPLTPRHVVDLVVSAGAEALGVAPQAMRPATAAMVERMLELGVGAAELDGALKAMDRERKPKRRPPP